MHLLIVDDNATNLKLLHAQLEAEGHSIVEATNGVEALQALGRESVDGVVSDILMPEMDGFRLCLEIRKNHKLCTLPFIFYTSTYSSPQDKELAITVGADHYLTKPSPTSDILSALQDASQTSAHRIAASAAPQDETYVLKQYSQALVHKLEERNTEVEDVLRDLRIAHDRVQESEERFRQVAENIREVFWLTDPAKNQILYVSPGYEDIWGRSCASVYASPHDWIDAIHPEDRERVLEAAQTKQASGDYVEEYRIVRPDGSIRWILDKAFPVFDRDGNMFRIAGIAEDITERKRVADELRESERRFSDMLGNVDLVSMMLDGEARITYCNDYLLRLTGWQREEVLGQNWFELFIPTELDETRGVFADLLADLPQAWHHENEILTRSGERRLLRWNNSVLRSVSGEVIGTASIGEDVTDRKRAERELHESETKYRGLIDQASDGIFVSDTNGNFQLINARGCELLGYAEHELVGLNAKQTFLEEEREIHTERVEQLRSGQTLRFERMVSRKDGSTFPAEISLKMLDTGKIQAIFHDISSRRTQELKIARLSRIQQVLSGINSAIVRIRDRKQLFDEACVIAVKHGGFSIGWIAKLDHASGTLVPISQAGLPMDFGAGDDALNRRVGLVPGGTAEVALREKRPAFDNDIERGYREMGSEVSSDTLNVRRMAIGLGAKSVIVLPLFVEEQIFGILALYAPERNFFDDEEIKLLTELAGDVSFGLEFIAKEEKVDYLAFYDALTGLPNRSLFFDRLTHQLGTAARDGLNVALVLMDVDRFRLINDTLGRQAGDVLLKAIAQRIRDTFRDQDTVARVSADSFAVAVSGNWRARDTARLLELHNQQLFGQLFSLGKEELRVSSTSGVAVFPTDGSNPELLYANAEAALKKAKASGERLLFYAPEMNASVADSLRLENRLRQALDNGEMVLWYQPKVSVRTRAILGFEALMRWQDPETGMVPPAKFIPLMEQTGLILDAGRWAMLQVARDCKRWTDDGFKPPRVAVNVSPIQLRQKDFVATVVEAAQKTEEAGSMLDIEITESVIMENVDTIVPKLQTIRGIGVEIAVDDFGTGYSSLAYIARLPIHDLKIDRSFIVGMTQGEDSLTIVKSVISLAHSLRLNVVAEGVETEEQAALLLELGCDEMQGYLISKPVAPETVPELLRKQSQRTTDDAPIKLRKSGGRKKSAKRQ